MPYLILRYLIFIFMTFNGASNHKNVYSSLLLSCLPVRGIAARFRLEVGKGGEKKSVCALCSRAAPT